MKTTTSIKIALLFVFGLLSHGNFAKSGPSDSKDSSICLEIRGRLSKKHNNGKNNYRIELLNNNKAVDVLNLKGGGLFKFFLKKNEWYTVRIIEEGYESKLLTFNTSIAQIYDNYIYVLSFDVDELITDEESKELDSDALDFPLALFAFDERFAEFNFNEEYRTNIMKKLFTPVIVSNY